MAKNPLMPGDLLTGNATGVLIAAPGSGAGKTTLTLAILRALKTAGRAIVSAKSGPDYIDPKFHESASAHPCINLDAWAMDFQTLQCLAPRHAAGQDMLVIEGAMGLFDGASNGEGSAAELAIALGLPVVLVVDCARQAQSVAALVHGFQSYRQDVAVAGVILNKVGSSRHEAMLRAALDPVGVEVLGAMPRSETLVLPERHLGLVQAGEHPELEDFLESAADLCAQNINLDRLTALAQPIRSNGDAKSSLPEPLGQKIAIARDIAFDFAYPHLLADWQRQGAEISFFSPLEDETPAAECDAVFLPGGYPELHAGRLASAEAFKAALREVSTSGRRVYGECGGFMVLGSGLTDAEGDRHEMLGLLPLETSFKERRRHLGYRRLTPLGGALPWTEPLAGHEFHFASVTSQGAADPLFRVEDAEGVVLPDMGLRAGSVSGSFAHVISRAKNTQ